MQAQASPTQTTELRFQGQALPGQPRWDGPVSSIAFDPVGMKTCLLNLSAPCYVVRHQGRLGVSNAGQPVFGASNGASTQSELLAMTSPVPLKNLGDPGFNAFHGTRYAYSTGAMANGIASEAVVIAMGQAGLLGSFGAAGLIPARVKAAISEIQTALPNGPYAFNLIHSPSEDALERGAVNLYLEHGVRTVEASAYLDLTPHIVAFRAAGLRVNQQGHIDMQNRVIAKISRREVARKFIQPASDRLLNQLVAEGRITQQQAQLASQVPMADDITVEADSGGHTDNRPLVSLLPSILALRDEIQAEYGFPQTIRVGAAGGISTPASALAAFTMGAAYIVTGSVNQACLEAGASAHTKKLLAEADMADVIMAPAADMFEMGVKLQVLKRGTLFAMRAQKLYDFYTNYGSIDDIPAAERQKLEKQVFRRGLEEVWADTVAFFEERDPAQIERANNNPKRKMALIFRWYLGLSSRWSNRGEKGREIDYQIWCGPAMGAFNDWVRGSYLEAPANRRVVDVAEHIMRGAAYLQRLNSLKMAGLSLPPYYFQYVPQVLG
jgi:PfaD family protein